MRPNENDQAALQFIAEGVTELAGFDVAAISIVTDGFLHTVAVAGDDGARAELAQQWTPVEAVLAELENAEDWGLLKFVPYDREGPHLTDYQWVPDLQVSDEADAWHPHDLLLGLLTDDEGTLRGVLSIDVPRNGRRPGAEQRRILQLYARQAERAVIIALERGDFARDLEREHAVAEYRAQLMDVLSHELQNPLTAIRHNAELLRTDPALSGDGLSGLQAIERGAGRIQTMVEDLLVLARVGNPDRVLRESIDLGAVARDAVDLLAAEASRRGVSVDLETPAQELLVIGDPQDLDTLVANLLSNAIKYSRPHGRVSLVVRPGKLDEGEAELEVEDQGVGIAADDRARVFEEFFRSPDPQVRDRPGTGLGLAIVDRVVARHGGSVDLESDLGVGTRVRVRLPLLGADPG